MDSLPHRLKTYSSIATELSCLSNQQLSDLLDQAEPFHTGVGGTSVLLTLNEISLFVKKIPLTDLERAPENIMSTANLFDLPLYYQYGIGSKGFGAWRELVAYQTTSNWVIARECPHFSLLYHSRILPRLKQTLSKEESEKLESELEYWENHPKIRNRLEAVQNASADLILFLEYTPHNLHQWLGKQLSSKEDELEQSLSMIDENITTITEFMSKQKFIHGDLHFKNILTDGTRLYFTDFGLALSSKFELSIAEIEFFKKHHNYDQANAGIGFLDSIFSNLYGKELWSTSIQEYLSRKRIALAPALESRIKRHTPVALTMDNFYQELKKCRSTPYPTALLV